MSRFRLIKSDLTAKVAGSKLGRDMDTNVKLPGSQAFFQELSINMQGTVARELMETEYEVVVIEPNSEDIDTITPEKGTKSINGQALHLQEMEKCGEASGVKLKRKRNEKANQRTEPSSAYALFVKEEKRKIGPKFKLKMAEVNILWKTLTPSQKEPYIQLAKEDKLLLGSNYRKNRKRFKNKSKPNVKINQIPIQVKKGYKMKKKSQSVIQDIEETSELPSLCSLVGELKSLDAEIVKKTKVKHEQSQKLLKLKLEAEVQVKDINELESSLSSYQIKCKLLKKEHEKSS